MKPFSLLFLFIMAFVSAPAISRAEDNSPLPFAVSVGGQSAQVKSGAPAAFATIDKAVAANAALEVGAKEMVIVNIVAADDKGTPVEGATPAIIVIQSGGKTTLDKTMDGKKLAPGNYLMSVTAEGKSGNVFLKIQ